VNNNFLKPGEVAFSEGSFLVKLGAVCVILMGAKHSSAIVFEGDTVFVPHGFYVHALIPSVLVSCDPDKQKYDDFILDQLCFASRLRSADIRAAIMWLINRLLVTRRKDTIKIHIVQMAIALGTSREWMGKGLASLILKNKVIKNHDNTFSINANYDCDYIDDDFDRNRGDRIA